MALSKLLMSSIAVALVICGVRADSGIEELRSRISALESSVSERNQDIKRMDQSILNFESAIKEKSTIIFSLQSEIEILRKQAAADVEQSVEMVHKQAFEMERQVARLKNEIEAQTMKRAALDARGSEAENKAHELNLKLESFQETYEKQKLRRESTERALQVAEEELMKAQLEAASKLKRLTEVHEAWLPPWLALHMSHCREVVETHWNKHGKPALYGFFEKALEKSTLVQKWVEPHLHATRTVKVSVHENLKKHELTQLAATWELSWFLASAILVVPMFFLFKLLSAIFWLVRSLRFSLLSNEAFLCH